MKVNNKQPFIFLLSSDRSGSNLLLRMIHSHPLIFSPSPTHVFPILTNVIKNYGDLSVTSNWKALLTNTCQLINSEFGELKSNIDEVNKYVEDKSLAELIKSIYTIEAKKNNKSRIFIKLHDAYNYFDFLLENFTSAKFIHLVRDPRDMSLSWLNATGLKGGIMRAANIWKDNQDGYDQISINMKKNQYLQICYEQLLDEPIETLKSICEFLEIPFNKLMLSYHSNDYSIKLANKVQAWSNLSKPLLKSNYNKYKSKLSANQIEYIELTCQKHMLKYGYGFDLLDKKSNRKKLESILEKNEPWLKSTYNQISSDERRAHKKFQHAIKNCHSFIAKS